MGSRRRGRLGATVLLLVVGIAPIVGGFPRGTAFPAEGFGDPPSMPSTSNDEPSPLSSLLLSTYLGGSASDGAVGVGVDAQGNVYTAGTTWSADLPVTPGASDPTWNDGQDVFVVKFDPALQAHLYLTYLGGGLNDEALEMAVDDQGNVYVSGQTDSTDFPATSGAFDETPNGVVDAFVAKFNATGVLVYATYLGGAGYDRGYSIGCSGGGTAIVSGYTSSPDFPTTPGAFDMVPSGEDAFATKLSADGSTLLYSTVIGGQGSEIGYAMAVDAAGAAYVGGLAISDDLPTTPGAYDRTPDSWDAFLVKVDPTGSEISYGTYLGGSGPEYVQSIAVDARGNAYAAGQTASDDFPVTPGAIRTFHPDTWDAFVAKFSPDGSSLLFGTYLGGSSYDQPLAMASHPSGALYVAGLTSSDDFPVSLDALDRSWYGGQEGFVLQLDGERAAFIDSTFLGGESGDVVHGIAIPASGETLVAGETWSSGFPVTPSANRTTIAGSGDGFVAKIDLRSVPIYLETDPPGLLLDLDDVPVAPPAGFFCPANATHTLEASSPQFSSGQRYAFVGWSDGGPQTRAITCTVAATFTASFDLEAYAFYVDTSPAGLQVLVDGIARMAPYSEWCIPETLLSLDVPSPQTNVSVRQVFHHWSDGADAARTVSCTAPLTLTAYFFSQYAVQLATEPSELVVLHNGVPQNTPAILWCDAGGTYHVTAAASQGNSTTRYMFLEWGSGGGFSLCLAPAQHLALYAVQHRIRVETEPTGFLVLFDGDPREAPFEVWCDAGALYELSAPLERGQDPRQYGFVGWSDAGSRERALECDGPRDLVASYALRPSALTTNALATVLLATAVAPVAVVLLLRPRKRRTRE